MSSSFFMFAVGGALALVALALHVAMIVHGFKTSVGWGLACLLLGPVAGLVFAFSRFEARGRLAWASVFLIAFLGAASLLSAAAYRTARAVEGSAEAAASGMEELERQIEDLDELENLDLDLSGG